jgi:[amino group carrier protein]-L-2-aminoadipate 6-kinase
MKMNIIKIGGGAGINIEGIIRGLKAYKDSIIIHGANAKRDDITRMMGYEKKTVTSISGYSSVITDDIMIDSIMMAYSGLQNKRIVEICQKNGINAIGLSGIDGQLIRSRRNKGIRVEENGRKMLLHDLSGKPQEINEPLIRMLIDNGYTPVICIPTLDENGAAINSENDDIVALFHKALKAERVIQLIEAPGYLRNTDDENSIIREMTVKEVEEALHKSSGRMKRKLYSLIKLMEVPCTVHICDGRTQNPLKDCFEGKGTVIR